MLKRCISLTVVILIIFSAATTAFAALANDTVSDDYYVTATSGLWMRSSPEIKDNNKIVLIPSGTVLDVAEFKNGWARVEYNGREGWCSKDYLAVSKGNLSGAEILAGLNALRLKFPDGKYWNSVGKPAADHDSYTETGCANHQVSTATCIGQCDGFARKLGLDLFGTNPNTWKRTDNSLSGLCVGDIIRYGNQHTIMVTGFDPNNSDILYVADCNWDYHCQISWDRSFSVSRYIGSKSYYVLHVPYNTLTRSGGSTTPPATPPTSAPTTPPTNPSGGNVNITRLSGDDRIKTACSIAAQGWSGGSDVAILAYSMNYADALVGVPLAKAYNAPILLTQNKGTLEAEVAKCLKDLKVKTVYILGSNTVVSDNIAGSLTGSGYAVKRLAGETRYETAIAIAKQLSAVTGKAAFSDVFFVCSDNFPDALSISTVAALKGCPILYISPVSELNGSTKAYAATIKGSGATAVIIGSVNAVSAKGEDSIKGCGFASVKRIEGTDRYKTCCEVYKSYKSLFTGKDVAFATGVNFPDALAGGALAAKYSIPIMLTSNAKVEASIASAVQSLDVNRIYAFGGSNVVSDSIIYNHFKK